MAAAVFLRVHTTESIFAPNEDDDFGLTTMPCNVIRNSLWSEFFQHILTSSFFVQLLSGCSWTGIREASQKCSAWGIFHARSFRLKQRLPLGPSQRFKISAETGQSQSLDADLIHLGSRENLEEKTWRFPVYRKFTATFLAKQSLLTS